MFRNMGIEGRSTGLFATGIYGIVKVISCTIFLLFMADSLGRRLSLLWTSIGQGVCMLFIGLYIRIEPPIKGVPTPPVGYVSLVCIYLFAAFFQFGWGPCCWILASEIPTARLRATNVSLAASTQWLFNFVIVRAVPVMLVTVGKSTIPAIRSEQTLTHVGAHGYGTYIIFSSFAFSMFVFVWFFIPETKGLSLEAMDALFGVVPHDELRLEGGYHGAGGARDSIEKDHTTTQIENVNNKAEDRP